MEELFQKGRGGKTGVDKNLVPVRTRYWIGPSTRKTKKGVVQIKGFWVPDRIQWILPKKAFEKIRAYEAGTGPKAEIDEEAVHFNDIKIPTPEDPERMHEHENFKGSHKVGYHHEDDRKAHASSLAEMAEYWKLFHNNDPDKVKLRLHAHRPSNSPHPATKLHEGEVAQAYHRDEIEKFKRTVIAGQEGKNWLEDPSIIQTITRRKHHGNPVDLLTYSKGKFKVSVFEDEGIVFVQDCQGKWKRFVGVEGKKPVVEAMNHVAHLFSENSMKKSLDLAKSEIIQKIMTLSETEPIANKKEVVLNKFKSGEDEIVLAGIDGNYSVTLNGTPLINDTDFSRVVAKYYKLISNAIKADGKNKDMALELFGEKVMQINRAIRPMIDGLGDKKAAMFLLDFSYDVLDLPFDEASILKFEMPRVMQTGGVPPIEEMGSGADTKGLKPSKEADKTLPPSREKCQDPIEVPKDRSINPAVIVS